MLRKTAQDQALSFESRGVVAYLLSKPDDWEISLENLMREGNIGRTKMRRIIAELSASGYLHYTQEQGAGGKFTDGVYTLHEAPQPESENVTPVVLSPESRFPQSDNPQSDNVHQHNIESTDSENQTEKSKDSATPPPAPESPPPIINPLCASDDAPENNSLAISHKAPPKKPKQPHVAIIEDGYLAALDKLKRKPIEADSIKRRVVIAATIRDAGYTPLQVYNCVMWVYSDANTDNYWKQRTGAISLEQIAAILPNWDERTRPINLGVIAAPDWWSKLHPADDEDDIDYDFPGVTVRDIDNKRLIA
jgi:hypothetical protein